MTLGHSSEIHLEKVSLLYVLQRTCLFGVNNFPTLNFSTTSLYQRLSLLLLQFNLFPNFRLLFYSYLLSDHPYPLLSDNSFKNDACYCPTKNWLPDFQLKSTQRS